jgi:hypothetical protein
MRRSDGRILTTHTGSLPRPLELTRLYARRVRGEAVDAVEIEQAGHAALQGIIPKQIDEGPSMMRRRCLFQYVWVPLMRHHPRSFRKQIDANAKQNIFPFAVQNMVGVATPGRRST